MFCSKCGDQVEQNEIYCNKCGNYLGNNNVQNLVNNTSINNEGNIQGISNNQLNGYQNSFSNNSSTDNKKMIFMGVGIGVGILLLVMVCVMVVNSAREKYYFSNNSYENSDEIVQDSNNDTSSSKKKGKYSTVIIADNTYTGVKISNAEDAYNLISEDSVSQKNNCPSEIKGIENELIDKYGIAAVNLCEMDVGFAREVVKVFEKIYEEYPSVRGYLTNLSLINAPMSQSYIAAFMPAFTFATADSSSTYPWVMKTQVLLNTSYFLNSERLEASVTSGSSSGHFPPNATMYSPVAHELGHYLSFLAMMKSYKLDSILLVDNNNLDEFYAAYSDFQYGNYSLAIITEAYENYKRDTNTTLTFDEWRATISNYAVARDNNGNYIYDETIAEGFHDVYLNSDNAKDASKYVVNVLKEKLEGEL